MSNFTVFNLFHVSELKGNLTVVQHELPFKVTRSFWITDADSCVRGGHRHHVNRQALIAVSGVVTVYMNDGVHEENIVLDVPHKCLLVEPEDWHTMSFSPGSVLLVFASHPYDRLDYVDEPYPIRAK